jgi:hypothetical protein
MKTDLLSQVLARPESLRRLSPADWEAVTRQARHTLLLARLAAYCARQPWLDEIPARARGHLDAAQRLRERQFSEVHWEMDRIRRALAAVDTPIVILKGAAYVMAGLPPADGRLFSDIDIMVRRDRLTEAEAALRRHGWLAQAVDDYDQRYYRQWSHELPPLHHILRDTVLDVHHAIAPPISRYHADSEKLFAAARPLGGHPGLFTLAPADMVLHSATHLFQEGDFTHGLRDLVDIDDLMRHFGQDAAFWPALAARAAELGLGRLLYYAVTHLRRLFATPMPAEFVGAVERFGPAEPARRVMEGLLGLALRPDHSSCDRRLTGLARWVLYVRAHYLRMPLYRLVPHLVRKAYLRRVKTDGSG